MPIHAKNVQGHTYMYGIYTRTYMPLLCTGLRLVTVSDSELLICGIGQAYH